MYEMVEFKELFSITKGTLQSSKCITGKYTFVTAAEQWKTHNEYDQDCEALIIAVAASGSLGRVHFIKGKFIASDLCFILKPTSRYINKIDLQLYQYILNSLKDDLVAKTATGTSKKAINQNSLSNYKIPLVFGNSVLKKIQLIDNLSENLKLKFSYQINLFEKLHDSILRDAIQGKLVRQNMNDEPAHILLQKITDEKANLIKIGKLKKEKPLSQISSAEIPFNIPKGWVWTRLGEICYQITDGTHYTPSYVSNGIPFLSVKDVSSGEICFENTKFISDLEHQSLKKRCNPEFNDILLTKVGTTGIAVPINTKKEFSIFVSLALLKFNWQLLNKNYLIYLINSPFVKIQSEQGTQGIGNKNLVLNTIKHFIVPIPPIQEQLRIVTKIEQLLTYCSSLNKMTHIAKSYVDNLLRAEIDKLFCNHNQL